MIDFNGYTRSEIQSDLLSRVPDTIDKREGSIIQTALGPVAWYLEGLYMLLSQVQENAYADTAVGQSLDHICFQHDITRKPARSAVRQGIFNMEIPTGSIFKTIDDGKSVIFESGEQIDTEEESFAYAMTCKTAGEIGNVYFGNVIPVTSIPGLTKAILGKIITQGTEEESDNDLRKRLIDVIQMPSTSGNRYDYYNWAMEVDGTGMAKVFPLANGPGTVKVIIADANMSAASSILVKAVKDHIEDLRPIGADVTVMSAVEKEINISASIKLRSGMSLSAVQNAFKADLQMYLHSAALNTSYVSMARIGNLLLGVDGVEDYADLLLNGSAANVALTDEEIAVTGTITLEVT